MNSNLPQTFDGLVNEATSQGRVVGNVLEQLKRYLDARVDLARERHAGRVDEIEELARDIKDLEQVLIRVWQAIGMTEGLLETLEKARQERPRSLS